MAGRESPYWQANRAALVALCDGYAERHEPIPWLAVRSALPHPQPTVEAVKSIYQRSRRSRGLRALDADRRGDRGATVATPPPVPEPRDTLREWLDTLRPVELRVERRPRRMDAAADVALVGSDFHFPQHDPAACTAFLDAVAGLRPRLVVLNGDTCDLLAVSRFPKDLRHTWSLAEERDAYHAFLAELFDVTAGWPCEIVETNANHSGNSVEGRWMRYLSERLGELAALPDVADALSYQAVWFPKIRGEADARIRLVDHVEIADGLIALHGDIARKKAAYSASGMLEKWRHSLIHGHTHRLGSTGYRLPAVGARPESSVAAYEGGCLCRLEPHYSAAPDWRQGFAVVRHSADRRRWNVELVGIDAGAAVVGGPGRVLGAAA